MRLLSLFALLAVAAEPVFAATVHGDTTHGDAHSASESGAGLPQLDPTWYASQIFWMVVVFIIMYLYFSRKSLPVISAVLENRREHIQSDLDTADRLTKEADLVQKAYEEGINQAKVEAAGVISDAEAAMNLKATRMMESFQERSARDIAATEARIAKAKADVMYQIDSISAEVASEVAARIVSNISFSNEEALAVVEKIKREERISAA